MVIKMKIIYIKTDFTDNMTLDSNSIVIEIAYQTRSKLGKAVVTIGCHKNIC